MCIALEATIDTISLLPTAPQIIVLSLKLVNGRLSLSLEIIDHATFAPIMQLKMKHTLCKSVPYTTPLEIHLYHYFRNVVLGEPQVLSFKWTIELTLASLYPTEATAFRHSRELAGLKPS